MQMKKAHTNTKKGTVPPTTPPNPADMMGGMGGMMGGLAGMMGGMMPPPPVENDSEAIDVEAKDVTEEPEKTEVPAVTDEDPKDVELVRYIDTLVPFNLDNQIIRESTNLGILSFICKDRDGKLFIISRDIIIDSEVEEEMLREIPFHDHDSFMSTKLAHHMVLNNMDRYISDFDFHVADDFKTNPNPEVYITGKEVGTESEYKIYMDANAFACLNYIDDYVFRCDENEHDLSLAVIAGNKRLYGTKFFVVSSSTIVQMANTDDARKKSLKDSVMNLFNKKENNGDGYTNIALNLKLTAGEEVASLLVPFSVEEDLDKSKFADTTVKKIEDEYFKDSDQYACTLLVEDTVMYSEDEESKNYMMVRGKNKDGMIKIFLFDYDMIQLLVSNIKKF